MIRREGRSQLQTSSLALVAITLAITITGYVRELVLASLFGVGAEMDAFYFSLALVAAVYELAFAGPLAATIVPLLHARGAASKVADLDRARIVLTAVLVVTGVAIFFSAILWAEAGPILDLVAPHMSAEVRASTIELLTVLVWTLPAGALTALITFVLNAHHRFLIAALAYLGNNAIFVVVLLMLAPIEGSRALPIAALAGPVLTIPLLALQLTRIGLLRVVRPDFSRELFQSFWRLGRPLLLSFGIGSIGGLLMTSHLIIRAFAADYGQGAIAALAYAFRLYEVPLSLLANPTATLVLPVVASLYAAQRLDEISSLCRKIFLWGLIMFFPATVVTWADADWIVHVLLLRGSFDADAARITAQALHAFAPAVMAEAVLVVFFRIFYALHVPMRTVQVAFAGLASLVMFLWLVPRGVFGGIPLALSAAFAVAAFILLVMLIQVLGRRALPNGEELIRWGVCATLALAAWKLAQWRLAGGAHAALGEIATFIAVYLASVVVLLPGCRRSLSDVALRASQHLGWRA